MRPALAVVLAFALAGCGRPDAGTAEVPDGVPPIVRTALLAADVTVGTVPLLVNFTLEADPDAASWDLAFGDGALANGTGFPSSVAHTYVTAGNRTALLTVRYPDGANATAEVALALQVPEDPMPEVVRFELGESLGCAGDAGVERCMSFLGGPDASGIDGHWLGLDERYWGLGLSSVTRQSPAGPVPGPFGPVGADSDCVFVDADEAILGTADNSNLSCAGVVPAGTAFLFIYPYALPAMGITVDFAAATA